MSEVSERYHRLSDAFAAKIAAVPADTWENPTPCDGWNARDVVRHVVDTQGLFLGFVGHELGDIPRSTTTRSRRGTRRVRRCSTQLDDPERARRPSSTASTAARRSRPRSNRFLCVDHVVHGWDLARAAGLDERIDPEDVARVREQRRGVRRRDAQPAGVRARGRAPAGADDQARCSRSSAAGPRESLSSAPRPRARCRHPSSGSP